MELLIDRQGQVRCLYDEAIDLHALGQPHIRRASFVEPDAQGRWWADLAPLQGPKFGPFKQRSEALQAEQAWLNRYWLTVCTEPSLTRSTDKGLEPTDEPVPGISSLSQRQLSAKEPNP